MMAVLHRNPTGGDHRDLVADTLTVLMDPAENAPTTANKRWVTYTDRDNQGLPYRRSAVFEHSGEPGTSMLTPVWATVGSFTRTFYDDLGRVTAHRLRSNATLHSQSRTRYQTAPGNIWTGPPRWVVATKDGEGHHRLDRFDAFANLVRVDTGANCQPPPAGGCNENTFYRYDAADRLVSIGDDQGNWTTIGYDFAGRKVSLYDPDTGRWTYDYDDNGNPVTQTDPSGTRLWHQYDPLNRLTKQRVGNSTGTLLAEYRWDLHHIGALAYTRSHETAGTITMNLDQNDPAGRPGRLRWFVPDPSSNGTLRFNFTSTYGHGGQLRTRRYPANDTGGLGETVTHRSNPRTGLPVSVTSGLGDTYVTATGYAPGGQIGSLALKAPYPNGASVLTWFDPVTRRVSSRYSLHGTLFGPGSVDWRFYDYDRNANIEQVTRWLGPGFQHECFDYDHLDRLTDAYTTTTATATAGVGCAQPVSLTNGGYDHNYTLDAIGNLTFKTGPGTLTYGTGTNAGPHAVTATGKGDSFAYDADGQQVRRTLIGRAQQILGYTPEQHLGYVDNGTGRTTYGYDTDGERILADDGTNTTITLGGLYERTVANATGTKTTETSYYPGPGGTHAMRIDGTVKYLFRDHLDTVIATWDPATNNVTRHGYHPYGTRRFNTAASGTAHGYTGQRHDPTGLSYYHARYYDPYTGRFTGPDTIIPNAANPQNLNLYAYVNGNPIRFNDPTGHCVFDLPCPADEIGDFVAGLGQGLRDTLEGIIGIIANPVETFNAFAECVWGPVACGQALIDDFIGRCETKGIANCAGYITFDALLTAFTGGWGAAKNIPKIRRLKNIRRNTTELPNGTTVTAKTSLVDNLVAVVCRVNSFVPDTLVLMADGTTKPIEDVEIGDYVWATDPETGEAGPRRVVDTIVGGGTKELVDINIVGSTITATDQHPFWVDDRGRWIDAGDLHAGDVLLLADGSTVTVDGVGERVAVQRVHNLTVDGIHTYHVVVDDSAVLVHNCTIDDKILGQMGRRGWTVGRIEDVVENPSFTRDVWDRRHGKPHGPATAYAWEDHVYVVLNDATGEVVQISHTKQLDWKPVWNDPDFLPPE